MRLISCYIENFGKMRDVSFTFSQGLNVICQDNGWGKSTLAAFIKAMLYGFEDEKARDELKNERKRYKPWQGGVYGGRLEFEADGNVYVATRIFGTKEKDDRFDLRRKDTNLESNDFTSLLGEELFQLDSRSFARTVYISQSDCETYATDGINAKIGNLAEDTGDINNYETVNRNLTDLLNQMSPTRKTGSINKMRDEISRLEESVRAGQSVGRTIDEVQEKLHRQYVEQQTLKEEQTELLECQKKIAAYKDIQAKKDRYSELCEAYILRKGSMEEMKKYFPGKIPEESELEKYIAESSRLSAMGEAVNLYRLTDAERIRVQELGSMFRGGVPGAEELQHMDGELKKLQEIRLELAKQQLSPSEQVKWEEYEERFCKGVPDQQELEEILSGWSSCIEKKSVIKQKKLNYETLRNVAQAGAAEDKHSRDRRGNLHMAGFLICAFFGVVMIVTGLLSEGNLSIALTLVGVLLTAIGACLMIIGRRQISIVRDKEQEEADGLDGLDEMRQEIEDDEIFIEQIEQAVNGFLERNGITYYRETEILDCLYDLKADIRAYSDLDRKRNLSKEKELQECYKEAVTGLQEFFGRFYPDNVARQEAFSERLDELKSSCREYERLNVKQGNFTEAVKDYGQLNDKLEDYVDSLSMLPQKELGGQLMEIQKRLHHLNMALQEFNIAKRKKLEFEQTENMESIMQVMSPEDAGDLDEVNERLEDISLKLEKIYQYIAGYNRQLEGLRELSDSVTEDEDALKALREKYRGALNKYGLIEKTRDFLEQAKISFTARYTAPLRESFGKYYEMISSEDPGRFLMDANSNVTVDEKGMQREPRFFSAGYRDLIGICMRMALVDAMYQADKPFVIFDDPFANLDGGKLEGALQFLEEIGEEYQILYFTCHESRAAV